MTSLVDDFTRFADLLPEPILLVSSCGQLCAANAGARSALFQEAPFTSQHLSHFVENAAEKVVEYLRACSRSAQPLPGLLSFHTARGSPAHFRCQGSTFRSRDAQQRPLVVLRFAPKEVSTNRFVALNLQIAQLQSEIARRVTAERTADEQRQRVSHEISESRKLQRELLRQTEALQEADRRKDQFLAVLAHELRNPLAPLRNGLQIARMKVQADETLKRTVEMMERQLVHLVRLVNDLMDVSRVSRGVIELRRAPVFITDVLARSVEAVRADMEVRGHELQIDIQTQNIGVDGDADRLTQVFSNLLTNSAKYSPDGGCIRLSVVLDGSDVVIRVSDAGIGIPPEQLDRVFDMFSQVRAHQGRSEGGLGIGLSLVRTLVHMHDGSINAHSEGTGTGSSFTVRLPALPPALKHAAAPLPTQDRVAQSLRVLVADDNEDSAQSLRQLLEGFGHEVRTARNGREALLQVEAFHPALVFMDVGMPDLNGLEATRVVRQRPHGKDIVIVALTGWGQPQDREQTKQAGVDRHIVKPISPEDIAEVFALVDSGRQLS